MNHLLNELIIVRVHLSFYSMGDVVASQVTMFVLYRTILLDRQHEEQLDLIVSDNDSFDSLYIKLSIVLNQFI